MGFPSTGRLYVPSVAPFPSVLYLRSCPLFLRRRGIFDFPQQKERSCLSVCSSGRHNDLKKEVVFVLFPQLFVAVLVNLFLTSPTKSCTFVSSSQGNSRGMAVSKKCVPGTNLLTTRSIYSGLVCPCSRNIDFERRTTMMTTSRAIANESNCEC